MNSAQPSYEDLRQAVVLAQEKNLTAAAIDQHCLNALVELGVVVHVGGGLIEATSHGHRMHRRLLLGEHIAELDTQPELPRPWLT
jgi:hypothetical protein